MFENIIDSAFKREQRIFQMSHNILLYMLVPWLHKPERQVSTG